MQGEQVTAGSRAQCSARIDWVTNTGCKLEQNRRHSLTRVFPHITVGQKKIGSTGASTAKGELSHPKQTGISKGQTIASSRI